jgi:predicted alpha-1,6-mannanase (GH76 family)
MPPQNRRTSLPSFVNNPAGGLTEPCEAAVTCNRDQMTFKGILARGMADLYRETSDPSVRSAIMSALDKTVAAMVANSCNGKWNCNGNFVSLVWLTVMLTH